MSIETPPSGQTERCSPSLLARARSGDDEAFRELVTPYARELHVHCYRMLGSLMDADDLLQETLTAAWLALDAFAGRSSLRTWLYRIATNRCLNAIRDGKRRQPPEPVPPFSPPEPSRRGEVSWMQPYPDALLELLPDLTPGPEARYQRREAIELAFIVALQHLPPRQAAALLLRDVVGFGNAEVAGMLGTTPVVVKGLLQRARGSVAQRRKVAGANVASPAGSASEHHLARKFAAAFVEDDFETLVTLLTDDAWLAMPPAPHEYHGPEAIVAFLRASAGWRETGSARLLPTRANGQTAFGVYLRYPREMPARGAGLLVLTEARDRIVGITRFLDPGLMRAFDLPDSIA